MLNRWKFGAALAASALALTACSSSRDASASNSEGSSGLRLPSITRSSRVEVEGIGVNSFLWRASLDTISFMPLSEVDPFGGVIITDWYANPSMPTERFKLTVYILDTRLRADAIAVNVFRQVREDTGGWIDAPASTSTAYEIESAILTRARQLRISQLED